MSKSLGLLVVLSLLLGACSSSEIKARKAQREVASEKSKLFCEFLNAENYTDIDVVLNIKMADKCDSEKSFSVAPHKTPSGIQGLLYCCGMPGQSPRTPSNVGKVAKPAPRPGPVSPSPQVTPPVAPINSEEAPSATSETVE